MREAWTDERLDDLKEGMHREFDRVHDDFRALDARFDSLQRTLTIGCVSIVASILAAVVVSGL